MNRIRDLREDMDLRQVDVAAATGIDQKTLSNYETGKTQPDARALVALTDFFHVSIDYLVGRTDAPAGDSQYLIHELNGMKKRLLSFEEFAKDAQPEALFTLVHSIVDRIYITTDGTKQKCQVYIKGCATENYSDILGAAGYIEEEPLLPMVSYMPPMCDLDYYSISKKS